MISRPTLSAGDIPIAPRKSRQPISAEAAQPSDTPDTPEVGLAFTGPQEKTQRRHLPKPSAEARKEASIQRALDQERARTRLRDLKRAQARESKHFVNVPLDYDTKRRLQKAALENDLKMTVIMKAAIDQYLSDNGY